MRRPTIAVVLVATISLLAACASSEAPGWTYAPAPAVTPAASAEASGSPVASAPATAEPTPAESPAETGSPGPSGSGGAEGLTVTAPIGATTGGFDPTELQAPADTTFTVTFDNQDAGVPHNWVLKNPDGTNVNIGDTTFFNGVEQRAYTVPALAAGGYSFLCEVHPTTMTGTLTAG